MKPSHLLSFLERKICNRIPPVRIGNMINETITVLICFNFLHHFGIQTLLCQTNQRNRCIGAYKHSFFTYSLQNTHFILENNTKWSKSQSMGYGLREMEDGFLIFLSWSSCSWNDLQTVYIRYLELTITPIFFSELSLRAGGTIEKNDLEVI